MCSDRFSRSVLLFFTCLDSGFGVDVWSCGVILYVLLCGFPPFYADHDAELYRLIGAGQFSFPSPYWDDVSDNAKDLIRRMLVVDPTARFTPQQVLQHPFITNFRSLSFTRTAALSRELSLHLVTQKKLKKVRVFLCVRVCICDVCVRLCSEKKRK